MPYLFAQNLDEEPTTFLARHANGDWSEVDDHDRHANEYAVEYGVQVLSAFTLRTGQKIWIITEADRIRMTILLPGEY